MHIQLRLIVKNELVISYGFGDVVSVLGINTLKVAQQSSNFSSLNIVEVSVTAGSLLTGIASGVAPVAQVYRVTGLVLLNVVGF